MHILPLFLKDPQTGIVVPELTRGTEWAKATPGEISGSIILVTIKVDGWHVRVKVENGVTSFWRRVKMTGDQSVSVLCRKDVESDAPIFEAIENYKKSLSDGNELMVYGPMINGNPQKAKEHLMVSIKPIEHKLIQFGTAAGIEKGGISVQRFYDSIQKCLTESNVQGIVFHLEQPSMTFKMGASVDRKDFGLKWPL